MQDHAKGLDEVDVKHNLLETMAIAAECTVQAKNFFELVETAKYPEHLMMCMTYSLPVGHASTNPVLF